MNMVALIAIRGFRPMCAQPIYWNPTAPTWCWPLRSVSTPGASGPCDWRCTKDSSDWSPNSCVRSPSVIPPRFKYFKEAKRGSVPLFLPVVPLISRGMLQGVLVVQTTEARVFREDEVRMLTEAAAQLAPVVAEARTLDRFIAPVQERLWAWPCDYGGAGTTMPRPCSASWSVRWRRSLHNPISLLNEIPLAGIQRRNELVFCLGASITPTVACASICRPITPGAPPTPEFCGPVPWRLSAEFGLHESVPVSPAAWACWPAITLRAPRTWIFLWSEWVCLWPGLFPPAPRPEWMAARRLSADRCESSARWRPPSGRAVNQWPSRSAPPRHGYIRAKVWRVKVGRIDLLLLDSNVEGNAPEDRELTSRLYGGDGRVRIRFPGDASGRGRIPCLEEPWESNPGVLHLNEGHSGFAVLEAIHDRMNEEGVGFQEAHAARIARRWSLPPIPRCPRDTTASIPA